MRLALCLLALCLSLAARSAETVVKGTVKSESGKPMPFAYISVSGKPYATQADKNGLFSLSLPDGHYTLKAQLQGYEDDTKELTLSEEAVTLDFVLKEDLINLNAVTVTGTRTPRLLGEAPVVTQIITEDDIRKLDATNVRDVLQQELPGLEFTFQMDQQVALSMQGLGGLAILILVDGERLAGETLDNTDFQRLTTGDIERIEVTKGAASALYGSNSVGAVVNIITKKAQEGWSANVNTHFSAHEEQRHGGSVGVQRGKWNSLTNVQYDQRGTFTIHDLEGDGATTIYGTRQWNVNEKLSFQPDERNTLTARGGYYFHERDYSSYKDNRARDFSGSLRWLRDVREHGKLDLSYTFDRYDKSDYYTEIRKDFLSYKNRQNTLRALYTQDFNHGITWVAGGDAMSDYLMSYQFEDDGSHRQMTADVFSQAEWQINSHWDVIAGLRLDWVSSSSVNLSPKVAAMYKAGHFKLRGSYSRGFRSPTLKERYMSFDMADIFTIYGNTDLSSEHSHSFALSAEYAQKRYSLTATGFLNLMRNEISTLWDLSRPSPHASGSMVYANIDGRNIAGADVTFMARYTCGIGCKVSYAYFHEFPKNEGGYNWSDSRPHSLTVKVDYRKTLKNYEFDLLFSGRWLSQVHYYGYSDDYSQHNVPLTSPRYTIWKLALSQRVCRAYNLLLSIDNIFNYRSKTFSYNSPVTTGRAFSATLSIDIDEIVKRAK
ncbi:MAG: TonB-dependent receptor [Prevotellaceae bacterium]|nr:TonB-dependent receptor [Prevotellaceae bacterium]